VFPPYTTLFVTDSESRNRDTAVAAVGFILPRWRLHQVQHRKAPSLIGMEHAGRDATDGFLFHQFCLLA